MLYLRISCCKASPKAISGRTSYLRVRLEFHRYPHVIPTFFNRYEFGPPCPFTGTSACTWIGHPVSGLQHTTFALFRLGFPSAPGLLSLNLAAYRNSQVYSTKDTPLPLQAVTSCQSMVSGSISLPLPGFFSPFPHGTSSLSVAV